MMEGITTDENEATVTSPPVWLRSSLASAAKEAAKSKSIIQNSKTKLAAIESELLMGLLPPRTSSSITALFESLPNNSLAKRDILRSLYDTTTLTALIATHNTIWESRFDRFFVKTNLLGEAIGSTMVMTTASCNYWLHAAVMIILSSFQETRDNTASVQAAKLARRPVIVPAVMPTTPQELDTIIRNSIKAHALNKAKPRSKLAKRATSSKVKPTAKNSGTDLITLTDSHEAKTRGQTTLFKQKIKTKMIWWHMVKNKFQFTLKDLSFKRLNNDGFNNLSNFHFDPDTRKYLGYGLKFIPPPKDIDIRQYTSTNFKIFSEKLKWAYFFASQLVQQPRDNLFNPRFKVPPSIFSKSVPPKVSSLLYNLESQISQIRFVPSSNFMQLEVKNLRNFSKLHPEVIFKEADKNLGLTAMDTLNYHKMVMGHLLNTNVYQEMGLFEDTDMDDIVVPAEMRLIHISKQFKRTAQETKYLTLERTYSYPKFHCLPKLHKQPIVGRPIIGSPNWVTTPYSIFLDEKLKSHLHLYPSILKNSSSLIDAIKEHCVLPSHWLVTLDVTSLYTNIDTTILCESLKSLPDGIHLSNLSKAICNTNYFCYMDRLYRQTRGIAMGTNAAVSLANFYLGHLLDNIISNNPRVDLYRRYIDDLFLIFNGSESDLLDLIELWNHLIPGIKFTYKYSHAEIDFLDLTIYTENDVIGYRTFHKTISRFLYIPPFSCHVPHSINGFLKGELTRYRRSNSSNLDFINTIRLFLHRLLERGYSIKMFFKTLKQWHLPKLQNVRNTLPRVYIMIPYTASTRCHIIHQLIQKLVYNNLNLSLYPVWTTSANIKQILLRSNLSIKQQEFITRNYSP